MRPPDRSTASAEVADGLAAVSRRLRTSEVLRTFAVAVVVAAVIDSGVSSHPAALVGLFLSAAAAVAWLRSRASRWSAAAAACVFERAEPESRNLIVTAEELLRHPDRARLGIRSRIFEQAARIACMPRAPLVPLKRDATLAAGAVLVAFALVLAIPQRAAVVLKEAARRAVVDPGRSSRELNVAVTITPPGYIGEAVSALENPDRIDAIEGSRLRLVLRGDGGWRARFGAEVLPAVKGASEVVIETLLSRSGYLAFEAADPGLSQRRRLVPVTVAPDRAPTIQIDAPAKDLLLPNAKPTVAIAASATDDFGLQALDLRYTKISGAGEQFEFQEGTLPLAITQESGRSWKARAEVALPTLGLAPGDSLVYRVVGRDRRPGNAGVASSDTFFIEIAGPGQVALAGFELPPDGERYALSQQMIVLKLERLKAREASIGRPALEEAVESIAAEQRAVKANFVFLTGGHVEDEDAEAEQSHEIQEGRLEHTARREIARAIQFMTRTEQGLAQISTTMALPPARAAVEALQRAFGRNRYFLRTLPVRSRVDPARRLTGELTSASDWRRELFAAAPGGTLASAQTVLARTLELAPAIRAGSVPSEVLTAFAEEALAAGPASTEWQTVSRSFLEIRDIAGGNRRERTRLSNEIVAAINSIIQRQALAARPLESSNSTLRGAWGRSVGADDSDDSAPCRRSDAGNWGRHRPFMGDDATCAGTCRAPDRLEPSGD